MTQRSNDGTDNREKNSKSAREVYLESAKISGKVRCLFLSLGFFCVEDLSFEINLDISGNNRKTRHFLPRDPFPNFDAARLDSISV